ncbi:hypothetical protein L9F63_021113, partial [Diploptera punctata]
YLQNWLRYIAIDLLSLYFIQGSAVVASVLCSMPTAYSNEFIRKLSTYYNPGCTGTSCGLFKVVYVRADGSNDSLHHLWDFTHKPSVFMAATSLNSNLNISWSKCNEGSHGCITFTQPPTYSFGIVLDKLWEYNDVNDTGLLNRHNKSKNYVHALHLENFNWTLSNISCTSNCGELVDLKATAVKYISRDGVGVLAGKITFMLNAFGFQDHSMELPRLLHSANSTQVDLVIETLKTNSSFTNSRYAIDVILASNDNASSTVVLESKKSLDDENSPGVFTVVDLYTPSISSGRGGYLQWRPVAYIAKERDISNSTDTNVYGVLDVKNHTSQLNNSILYSYYSYHLDDVLVQSTIVSFGLKEDGFYKKTNYTSWTFMMGYGKPPEEGFSLLVILVISIGLGLPTILIIASVIFVLIRRISQKKDDLFLNR